MDEDKPVELIRLPRKEAVYDRESIFGRDTASVFPGEAKRAKQQEREDIKKAMGLDSSKFITESELEKIKRTTGASVENGAVARDKTLAAILAENKAQKEEAFQQTWKTMKQGKNRPLDEDDLAFVNGLVESDQVKAEQIRAAERSDLDLYQAAVREALELRQQTAACQPAEEEEKKPPQKPAPKPVAARPLLKVKPKGSSVKRSGDSNSGGQGSDLKRPKQEETRPPDEGAGTLAGLMQGYASEDESS